MVSSVQPHMAKVPWPIMRAMLDRPLRFLSRSRGIFGLDTHYGNGATFICPGEETCERCRLGEPARYQGYLIGTTGKDGSNAVVHLTANAAIDLVPHMEGARGLLGAKIILTRLGPKSNGTVQAALWGWDEEITPVPWERQEEIVLAIYRVKQASSRAIRNGG